MYLADLSRIGGTDRNISHPFVTSRIALNSNITDGAFSPRHRYRLVAPYELSYRRNCRQLGARRSECDSSHAYRRRALPVALIADPGASNLQHAQRCRSYQRLGEPIDHEYSGRPGAESDGQTPSNATRQSDAGVAPEPNANATGDAVAIPHPITNTDAAAERNPHPNTGANPDADTGAHPDADSGTDPNAGAHANTDPAANPNTDTNADADTRANPHAHTRSDANANPSGRPGVPAGEQRQPGLQRPDGGPPGRKLQ